MKTISPSRWVAIVTIALVGAAALAGCSSSTTSTGVTKSSSISFAKTVLKEATDGVVGASSISEPLTKVTKFNGPTTPETKKPSNVSIAGIASCEDPCNYVNQLVGSIGKKVDNASSTAQVGNDPQGWQSLATTAVNEKKSVLLFGGVPDGALTQQNSAAESAGLKTVGVAVEKSVKSDAFDAYVSVRQDITYRLMMQAAIADSNGKAQVALFEPSGLATTDKYVEQAKSEFTKACPACSIVVVKQQAGALADPSQLDPIVTSTLNANPKVNYLLFGDDFYAFSAAQQAADRLNRKVTMIAQDGSTPGLAAVKAGLLKYDSGAALEWIAYAGYDAVRRVLTGEKLLAPNGWGGGAHLWTKSNLPSTLTNEAASAKWRGWVDYTSAYAKLWGETK